MGLDPTDTDFECGNDCGACWPVPFAGCTPKYVWANISGLVNCPVWPGALPNGTWKLTQQVGAPCVWHGGAPTYDMRFRVGAINSFSVTRAIDPFNQFFASVVGAGCGVELDNIINCGDPLAPACSGGKVIITWGPENPCE